MERNIFFKSTNLKNTHSVHCLYKFSTLWKNAPFHIGSYMERSIFFKSTRLQLSFLKSYLSYEVANLRHLKTRIFLLIFFFAWAFSSAISLMTSFCQSSSSSFSSSSDPSSASVMMKLAAERCFFLRSSISSEIWKNYYIIRCLKSVRSFLNRI